MTALSLAAPSHHRPRAETFAFYEAVARSPVAVVYLGETVCAKRGAMRIKDWMAIAANLSAAGKQVVIAGKGAIDSSAELRMIERVAARYPYLVEVNDLGAAAMLPPGRGFVAGALLNVFNRGALRALADLGAQRWVAPVEMDRAVLKCLLGALPAGMETEVPVYGRVTLSHSARCHSAAIQLRTRGNCERCCTAYPEGQQLSGLDARQMMVINGPQTLSWPILNLVTEVADLRGLGVSLLRIDPPAGADALHIIDTFARVLDGGLAPAEANAGLAARAPAGFFNGYWFGRPGFEYVRRRAPGAGAP